MLVSVLLLWCLDVVSGSCFGFLVTWYVCNAFLVCWQYFRECCYKISRILVLFSGMLKIFICILCIYLYGGNGKKIPSMKIPELLF